MLYPLSYKLEVIIYFVDGRCTLKEGFSALRINLIRVSGTQQGIKYRYPLVWMTINALKVKLRGKPLI